MKKSFYLIALLSFFFASGIFAQKGSLLLSFNATDYYSGDTLALDSIYVENPARNCDTMVYGNYNGLLLTWTTGIDEFKNSTGIQVTQNYPNPFAGSTKCAIKLADKNDITVTLADVYGKQLAVLSKTLDRGTHTFTVETGAGGIYFLTVRQGDLSKTLKLTCRNGSTQNDFNIVYSGNDNTSGGFKTVVQNQGFVFLPGDMLNMTPYTIGHESSTYSVVPVDDYTAYFCLKPNYLDFNADSTWGYVPVNATFTVETNIPNLTIWHWDFGDGETSELENPTHTYITPGTYYTVSLAVQGGDGSYLVEKAGYIHTLNEVAGVDFVADFRNGMAPLAVHFVAETNVANPTYWQWSFGDGFGAQNVQNPYHEYTDPGVYTVSVTVYDNNGQTTETKENYIHVNYCPPTVSDADGNVYNTVTIGNQCWMKENLNVGVFISENEDQTDNGIIEKFCYDGHEYNCDEYGGQYQLPEFMNYNMIEGTQGICPNGWHIPTVDDYAELGYFADSIGTPGGTLKETGYDHWLSPNTGANNLTGFTALAAGFLQKGAYFGWGGKKDNAFFGTSTVNEYSKYEVTRLYYESAAFWNPFYSPFEWDDSSSIRCIKDNEYK